MKPTLKLIFWPLIFIAWSFHRLIMVSYVNSPDFFEYWEEL